MNNTIERLKAWYMKTFLPFELEEKEETLVDEISELVDDWADAPYQFTYTTSSDPDTEHRV